MWTSIKAVASIFLALLSLIIVFEVVNSDFHGSAWPWLALAASSTILSLLLAVQAFREGRRRTALPMCGLLLALLTVPCYFYWAMTPSEGIPPLSPSHSNMKNLALAMLSYEKDHGTLSSVAVYGKDGQPLLSWRVLLLPYLEESELFQAFHLDEPWDSPHNLPLLEQMPSFYRSPQERGTTRRFCTYYQVFVGKGAAFEGQKGVSLQDFKDGHDRTLLIAEAGKPVPWTKPEDLSFAPDGPLPQVGGLFKDHFNAAFADGSVHSISKNVREQTLRALITRNAGDKPGDDWKDP